MSSRPRSFSERADRELIAAFARAHGCPAGCEACERTRGLYGVPALLRDWEGFVRGRDGLRVAVVAKRTGRPFPQMTNDPVVQFCIEEALFDRLSVQERRTSMATADLLGGIDDEGGGGGGGGEMDAARHFARTGEVMTP
ncbi:MAG: hypothetical protein AABM43_12890 [Actinomycetota bacterium]